MKHKATILTCLVLVTQALYASDREGRPFLDGESNFQFALKRILDQSNLGLTREELYRAATAGMLSALNKDSANWNKLLSPEEMEDLQKELSGKVSGIGIVLKFDEKTGYGSVLRALPGSPGERSGLKPEDQILSVNDQKFKGKQFVDLVKAIRGESGRSVELKVLREDRILKVRMKRETIPWRTVELESLEDGIGLLSIEFFNDETPAKVKEKLREIAAKKFSKVILDLRDNEGGALDSAVRTAELFLPPGSVIAKAKSRAGAMEVMTSQASPLPHSTQWILLVNNGTYCGAELFAAALQEGLKLKLIGEKTHGKWNAQAVETLPNHYGMKYTVKDLFSPSGKSYQGVGLSPDLEVALAKDVDLRELREKHAARLRPAYDPQLKVALEFARQ